MLQGPGSGQGKGACEKPSPRLCALPAPRSGLLFLLEGETVPPRTTCANLSLLAGPGAILGGCPSWRTRFGARALSFHTAPCRDGGDTVAGSCSASSSHPYPFRMGFSRVQTSCGILWHIEPRRELSVSAAVPQGAVTTRERVPGQLTALPAPADGHEIRGGQWHHKSGTLWAVRSPRGAGQGLLSDATWLLGTMQSMNKGSPSVTLQPGCPRSLPESTGTRRMGAPGADVTLGWQRGEGLGPAAEGAGASPSAPRRAAPSDSPVQLLGCIFSLRWTRRGC